MSPSCLYKNEHRLPVMLTELIWVPLHGMTIGGNHYTMIFPTWAKFPMVKTGGLSRNSNPPPLAYTHLQGPTVFTNTAIKADISPGSALTYCSVTSRRLPILHLQCHREDRPFGRHACTCFSHQVNPSSGIGIYATSDIWRLQQT